MDEVREGGESKESGAPVDGGQQQERTGWLQAH